MFEYGWLISDSQWNGMYCVWFIRPLKTGTSFRLDYVYKFWPGPIIVGPAELQSRLRFHPGGIFICNTYKQQRNFLAKFAFLFDLHSLPINITWCLMASILRQSVRMVSSLLLSLLSRATIIWTPLASRTAALAASLERSSWSRQSRREWRVAIALNLIL